MWTPGGNKSVAGRPSWRLGKLGIVLPAPAKALRPHVEASNTGTLRFLSGTLAMVNGTLAIAGSLGENLLGQGGPGSGARCLANALAVAKQHLFVAVLVVICRWCRTPLFKSTLPAERMRGSTKLPEFDNLASSPGCRRREVRSSSAVFLQALSLRPPVSGRGMSPI